MERNLNTGNSSWLTAKAFERDDFVLAKNEFQESMALRYGLPLKNLPVICDGYGEDFHVQHALICKKRRLITLLRANLLIRGVWSPQETALFDIRVLDTEAKSYSNKKPEDVLESCADENRTKYSEPCQEKYIAFTPLIFSVYGMMAGESKIFLRRQADRLASKWDHSYSNIKNWVKLRFNFTVLSASNLCKK